MAQKRRGKPKSAAKPKKKPQHYVMEAGTGQYKLTGAELMAKLDKLATALPQGEERDKLKAALQAIKGGALAIGQTLQAIINNKELRAWAVVATEVMKWWCPPAK